MASTAPWPRYVQVIVSPSRSAAARADRDRLLALAEVRAAADEALGEHALALLLELADLEHRAEVVQLRLLWDPGGVDGDHAWFLSSGVAAAASKTAARSSARRAS